VAGSTGSQRVRTFAKWNAIGAILLSLAGNATWHLVNAHLLPITWHVVMAVGAVPPVILGLVTHLAVLRRQVDAVPRDELSTGSTVLPLREAVPEPLVRTGQDATKSRPEDEAKRATPPRRQGSGTTPSRPRYGSQDVLMAAARAADAAYRAAHDGKGITRDALRAELRIGGERATAVLRRLRSGAESQQPLSIPHQAGS